MTTQAKGAVLGFFGNIWVRQNLLQGIGSCNIGHEHAFDHVSLLTEGTVKIYVENNEPKEFSAPTFIVIRKQHKHKFEAVTDKAVWYCVFALRDFEGQPIQDLYGKEHDPFSYAAMEDGYWEKQNTLDNQTTHQVSDKL